VVAVEQFCRGVKPETSAQALDLMQAEGVRVIENLDIREIKSLM
jgi:hypothetical protein